MADPEDDLMERARKLAAERVSSTADPDEVSRTLDDAFLAVAPAGARISDAEDAYETLLGWRFDPEVPIGGGRARFGMLIRLMKRLLRPLATWQLRHVTDQLNAYAAVQAEVLKKLAEPRSKP